MVLSPNPPPGSHPTHLKRFNLHLLKLALQILMLVINFNAFCKLLPIKQSLSDKYIPPIPQQNFQGISEGTFENEDHKIVSLSIARRPHQFGTGRGGKSINLPTFHFPSTFTCKHTIFHRILRPLRNCHKCHPAKLTLSGSILDFSRGLRSKLRT